jgi:adenylate cyclase
VEGVEVEITMLFADVRGSTTLAEKMSASDFGGLMNRFYETASDILSR